MPKPSETNAATTVRFPKDLRKKIQVEADADHRTFTSQLIYIVEQHYKQQGGK